MGEILYGEQTRLTLENMSFSGERLADYPEYIASAMMVKAACAVTNCEIGELPAEKAKQIVKVCEQLSDGSWQEQFPVDVFHGGGGIGINMNLNEVIAAMAGGGIHPVDDVNMSQSTSDVCHTALRITVFRLLQPLSAELKRLAEILAQKAREFEGIHTIARTCWQDGMKVSAGALFGAAAAALERQRRRLAVLQPEMLCVNLGGTVIGSGKGALPAYQERVLTNLKARTGLALRYRENLYDAAEYPDDLLTISAAVCAAADVIKKFAGDLRVLSSGPETGLGELTVPAIQAGSSFFPGKVNPVLPECVMQCVMLMDGNHSILQRAASGGEMHINLWEELMGFLLMKNLKMLLAVLPLFTDKCVRGVGIHPEVCEAYAKSSIPLIVEYKETYGYHRLADRIKKDGLEQVVHDLKNEGKMKKNV